MQPRPREFRQKVGLGVGLDREKGLRMTFTVDHVTYVSMAFADDGSFGRSGAPRVLEHGGIPRLGRPEQTRDARYFVMVAEDAKTWCPDFHAYVGDAFGGDGMSSVWEAPLVRRSMPVTAENCRLLLDGGYRDALFTAAYFSDVEDESVLPRVAQDEEGAESWSIRDRFAELLYSRGEGSLFGLLETEAVKRTQAYEAFHLRSASGARKRKLEFRSWMRS